MTVLNGPAGYHRAAPVQVMRVKDAEALSAG
jgi:hypothetical protein